MGSKNTIVLYKIKNMIYISIFYSQVYLSTEDAEEADRKELVLLPSDEKDNDAVVKAETKLHVDHVNEVTRCC